MKKIALFSFSVCLVLSGLTSCNKVGTSETDAVAPGADDAVQKIETDFVAALPDRARTTVDLTTGLVTWLKDDPILVSNGTMATTMYIKQGGGTGSPLYTTGAIPTGDAFYAVYPAGGAAYDAGTFSSTIPVSQSYVADGFATEVFPMVAACGADRQLAFKNAASLLKIVPTTTFFSDQTIASVTVSANEYLAGAISVSYTQGGTPSVLCTGSKSASITAVGGLNFGTPIYMVVAPGSYTGVTVTLTFTSGIKCTYPVGALEVERSKYRTLALTLADNYTDLSASATANCYMIKTPGSYKFRATVKGNGVTTSCGLAASTPASSIKTTKLYYSDGESFLDGGFFYRNGYVYFTTVGGTLPIGTALVSVTDDSGTTLWSWHIWANRNIADVKLSDNSTWLNMNLGAHQVEFNALGFNGYYYQWGRKDPIQQAVGVNNILDSPFVSHASQTDGSIANSIKFPLYFYGGYNTGGANIQDWCTFEDDVKYYDFWNKNITADQQTTAAPGKTMFDPCPPGYHVPTYAEVVNVCKLTKSAGTQGAYIDGKLFFPYVSSRAAGITKKWWGGVAESDTDTSVGERGFYHCTNPSTTGDKSNRKVYRWYARKGSVGYSGSVIQRAEGMVVRCAKD